MIRYTFVGGVKMLSPSYKLVASSIASYYILFSQHSHASTFPLPIRMCSSMWLLLRITRHDDTRSLSDTSWRHSFALTHTHRVVVIRIHSLICQQHQTCKINVTAMLRRSMFNCKITANPNVIYAIDDWMPSRRRHQYILIRLRRPYYGLSF